MKRLGLMSIAALAGIFLVMKTATGLAPQEADAATAPVQIAQAETVASDATPVPAPARPESDADQAPVEPVPAPVVQTPREEPMPGPTLRRSPEYAHRDTQPAASDAPLPEGAMLVNASSLNMRSGPSTSDSVIGKLARGQAVQPLGPVKDGWVEIKVIDSGAHGFTAAKFLKTP